MTSGEVRIEALGEGALLVTLGERIDPALNRRAHRLAAAVEAARAGEPWLGRPVPAWASVLIPFDPLDVEPDRARRVVAGLVAGTAAGGRGPEPEEGATIEIGVHYGGADGPDLADVAAVHGLRPADVVELHSAAEYRVFFLGFAPGFPYLGPLPAGLETPRLAVPRERVPAGSVGIAGAQTGIYPFDLPGGWRIVGRTEAVLWDAGRDAPALLRPGDRVRFRPLR